MIDRSRPPVRTRLGPRQKSIHERRGKKVRSIHYRLGPRRPERWTFTRASQDKGSWEVLQLPRYWPFHRRDAQCRDPPKCVVCSRLGHKARQCKASEAAPFWQKEREQQPPVKRSKQMEFLDPIRGAPERRPERVIIKKNCLSLREDIGTKPNRQKNTNKTIK
jgi:hypothetical protein